MTKADPLEASPAMMATVEMIEICILKNRERVLK